MKTLSMQAIEAACALTHTKPSRSKISILAIPYEFIDHEFVVTILNNVERTVSMIHVNIPIMGNVTATLLSERQLPE